MQGKVTKWSKHGHGLLAVDGHGSVFFRLSGETPVVGDKVEFDKMVDGARGPEAKNPSLVVSSTTEEEAPDTEVQLDPVSVVNPQRIYVGLRLTGRVKRRLLSYGFIHVKTVNGGDYDFFASGHEFKYRNKGLREGDLVDFVVDRNHRSFTARELRPHVPQEARAAS